MNTFNTGNTGNTVSTGNDEERDHLFRSLDDLDRELAAGDIDQHDYETLRADYTARAAASIRDANGLQFEPLDRNGQLLASPGKSVTDSSAAGDREQHSIGHQSGEGGRPQGVQGGTSQASRNSRSSQTVRAKRSPARRAGVALGVLGVAVGCGVAVARFAGERVGDQGLTGTVRQAASPQQQKAQALMQVGRDNLGSDPVKSLQAFDAALKIDPKLPEAMAYSGWVLRLASLSAEGKDAEELLSGALRRINEAILTDPAYPDSYAFKGVIALREQDDPKTALAAFKKLDGLQTPPFVQQLVDSARKEAETALASPSSAGSDSSPPETTLAP